MDKERIFFFIIPLLYILYGAYIVIVQYRAKDKIIIKSKLNKWTIVTHVVWILNFSINIYFNVDRFRSTKSFRNEYSIGFYEIMDYEKIESIVKKSGDYDDIFVKYDLMQIKNSRESIIVYFMLMCCGLIMLSVTKVRFEHDGIRQLNKLTKWEEYESYVWGENKIRFLYNKNNKEVEFEVKADEKNILDNYLKENTNIIENKVL